MYLPTFLIAVKIGGEAAQGVHAVGNSLKAADYVACLSAIEQWKERNPGKRVPTVSSAVMDIE